MGGKRASFACFVLSDAEGRGTVDERSRRLGSKVPGRLLIAGRTWLCYKPTTKTAAVPWRVLCSSVASSYFPAVLSLTLVISFFQVSATPLHAERHDSFIYLFIFL